MKQYARWAVIRKHKSLTLLHCVMELLSLLRQRLHGRIVLARKVFSSLLKGLLAVKE